MRTRPRTQPATWLRTDVDVNRGMQAEFGFRSSGVRINATLTQHITKVRNSDT